MTRDLWLFFFAAIACTISIGTILWRVLVLKINGEVLLLRHSLEKKDMEIEKMQDVHVLTWKGLEEKFGHFAARVKADQVEVKKNVSQIEHFLSKTTDYQPRD